MATHNFIENSIAQASLKLVNIFIERAETHNLKGKRRDAALMDYFVGAYALAGATGQTDLYEYLGRMLGFLLCVRGYSELATWKTTLEDIIAKTINPLTNRCNHD